MNKEDYAFKSSNELFDKALGIGDLLEAITFLQEDRKQWINQYTKAHNDYVELQQENHQLKEELKGYQTMYFDKVMIINKAIEYIENMYGNEIEFNFKREQLLKILEGEENNNLQN